MSFIYKIVSEFLEKRTNFNSYKLEVPITKIENNYLIFDKDHSVYLSFIKNYIEIDDLTKYMIQILDYEIIFDIVNKYNKLEPYINIQVKSFSLRKKRALTCNLRIPDLITLDERIAYLIFKIVNEIEKVNKYLNKDLLKEQTSDNFILIKDRLRIPEKNVIYTYYLPDLTVEKLEEFKIINKVITSQNSQKTLTKFIKPCLNTFDEFDDCEKELKDEDLIIKKQQQVIIKKEDNDFHEGTSLNIIKYNKDRELSSKDDINKQNVSDIQTERRDITLNPNNGFTINSQIKIKTDEKLEEVFTKVDFNKYFNTNNLNHNLETPYNAEDMNKEEIKIKNSQTPSKQIKIDNKLNSFIDMEQVVLDDFRLRTNYLKENSDKKQIKKINLISRRSYIINKVLKLKEN